MDSKEKDKIAKLLEDVRADWQKIGDRLDALDALLEGHASPGTLAKGLVGSFCRKWSAVYSGQHYLPKWATDTAAMKRLVQAFTFADIETRMDRYLASADPYYRKQRHPIGLFVAGVNQFSGVEHSDVFALDAPAVADCKHAPRCATDQQHTLRKLADARGQHDARGR